MHNNELSELRRLIPDIEARRVKVGLSKNAFCQKFGQTGSTKTYSRILDAEDDLSGLDIAGQLENYRAVWELFQDWNEDPEETRIYGDFGYMSDAITAVSEALKEPGNTRLVLVTAGPGGGKTTFLDYLQEHKHTARITYRVEATEAWRESTNELLGALLGEVGVYERQILEEGESQKRDPDKMLPIGPGARLRKLIDRINGRKVILAIDEVHHIGPAGFNLVKTLINQTRAVVVMAAIPEMILRINKTSHAEASQLFINRLYQHIRFGPPIAGDVLDFLKRRGVKFAGNKDASQVAEKIARDSAAFGLWKYVFRCARKARQKGGGPFTAEQFARIIVEVKGSISLGG